MSEMRATSFRTIGAGELRADHAGMRVSLAGWINRRRDLGGLIFIDLRDRSGIVQLSLGPDWTSGDDFESAHGLGAECVVAVDGEVHARPAAAVNPDMATGEVEVQVRGIRILAKAQTPPIPVEIGPADALPAEELRLRYRYLDLRRAALQRALMTRHRAAQVVRQYLSSVGFWEIETPMLTRRTPEGARDYLVPSRIHPGEFYALPQSPQLYKQLLMVSGYDRYFQIVRCLRDEDLRADRQPEFTQIDAEMSFVDEDDIFAVGEGMLAALWRELLEVDLELPFPRVTWSEAMRRWGTDKPDTRFGMEFFDLTDVLQETDFRIFSGARDSGARIRAFVAPGGASLSRKELDSLDDVARAAGAAGALWVKRSEDGFSGKFAKALDEAAGARVIEATGLAIGDLLVVIAGPFRGTPGGPLGPGAEVALDALRRHMAARLELQGQKAHAWLWVTDYPLFEWDDEDARLVAAHHPFTAPHHEDIEAFLAAPWSNGGEDGMRAALALRSRAYDAVYNGHELASGSIRIHDSALQRQVLAALGIDDTEAESKFGFLLEAFRYGAPPHGGFAFGFDRLVLLLAGGSSLRDVIAYPKTTAARALFEGAPSPVSDADLRDLHIALRSDAEGVQ